MKGCILEEVVNVTHSIYVIVRRYENVFMSTYFGRTWVGAITERYVQGRILEKVFNVTHFVVSGYEPGHGHFGTLLDSGIITDN